MIYAISQSYLLVFKRNFSSEHLRAKATSVVTEYTVHYLTHSPTQLHSNILHEEVYWWMNMLICLSWSATIFSAWCWVYITFLSYCLYLICDFSMELLTGLHLRHLGLSAMLPEDKTNREIAYFCFLQRVLISNFWGLETCTFKSIAGVKGKLSK